MSKSAIKKMLKNKSGKIVNITSVVGHTGNLGQACPRLPVCPTTDVILTIFPDLFLSIFLIADLLIKKVDVKLTSITFFHSSRPR